jgi:hypothetical protein
VYVSPPTLPAAISPDSLTIAVLARNESNGLLIQLRDFGSEASAKPKKTQQIKSELADADDADDEGIPALIPYSELNLNAIRFIEALAGKGPFSKCWFICENSRRGLIPLSMVSEKGVENFYFN